jgi:GAF domain-containing protein
LAETEIIEARRQALVQLKPAVVTINGHGSETGMDQDRLDAPEPQNGHTTPQRDAQPADRTGHQALVAPIILHQHPIGNLQLHYDDPERTWTDSELAFIKTVIEQVAQVAENLRLFTETKERISRERLLGKINDKMRRAPNIESLMEIAVEELGRVLRPARTFVRLGSEEQLSRSTNGQQNGPETHHQAERNDVEVADLPSPEQIDGTSQVNESTQDSEPQRS